MFKAVSVAVKNTCLILQIWEGGCFTFSRVL